MSFTDFFIEFLLYSKVFLVYNRRKYTSASDKGSRGYVGIGGFFEENSAMDK